MEMNAHEKAFVVAALLDNEYTSRYKTFTVEQKTAKLLKFSPQMFCRIWCSVVCLLDVLHYIGSGK